MRPRYLVDSGVLIWFARGVPSAVETLNLLIGGGDELGICAICVTEFFSGARLGEYRDMEEFIGSLEYWPITYSDAVQAGVYRHDFARRGTQLSTQDMLIAAVARRVGATVITENLKDFPMDDVRAVNLASL